MKTVVVAKLRIVMALLVLIGLIDLFTVWAIAHSLHFILDYLTTLQGATLHKQIVVYYSIGIIAVGAIVYTGIGSLLRIYNTAKFFGRTLLSSNSEEQD